MFQTEEIMKAIDEEFGQKEVYMWSTYMLPNGHFLNPENSKDLDQDNLDYEHNDYDRWIAQHFGREGQNFLDDKCIKMNVTYPYLYLPIDRTTPKQLASIRRLINVGGFDFDREGIVSWSDNTSVYDMDQPILILSNDDSVVFDLAIHNADDIIKAINRSYSLGRFFKEAKETNIYKNYKKVKGE